MTHKGQRRPRRGPRHGEVERGSVTAETAIVLPTLVLVAAALAWMVGLGVAQVQCVDAARQAARALARAESPQTATALALQVAPDGARVRLRGSPGMAQVEVTYRATPPGGLLDGLMGLSLRGSAVTPVEVADA